MGFSDKLSSFLQYTGSFSGLRKSGSPRLENEPALRSELFNAEQMAAHGSELAALHNVRLAPEKRRWGGMNRKPRLLERLDDNERVLMECCRMFSAVSASSEKPLSISPAGEWLLDNYWMVEEQIHTARKHLPRGYSRQLPELADGPSAGLPRVYDIALENISHGDGRLDAETLRRFVEAYQSVAPLTLGELWAIPIMLRLALIENLRRVASRVMQAWQEQAQAVKWADLLIETAGRDRKGILPAVAEMAAARPPMSGSFVAELARRLQGQSSVFAMPLSWVEDHLAESGHNIEKLIQLDARQQAADQVSISNSLGSLRLLAAVNWRDFVEETSVVERTLREDPSGVYSQMDFSTRDHYRHIIEALAKKYDLPETGVALAALDLTRENVSPAAAGAEAGYNTAAPAGESLAVLAAARAHVGWFLAGEGAARLKTLLARGTAERTRLSGAGSRPADAQIHRRLLRREHFSLSGYLGMIAVLTLLMAWPFAAALRGNEWGSLAVLFLGSLAALMVASQVALKLVNWLATLVIPPHFVPRLDYRKGLPRQARTLVVLPSLVGNREEAEELLQKIEVQFLANRDPHIQFGLLTDFKDSDAETQPEDALILSLLEDGIRELNRKYPGDFRPDAASGDEKEPLGKEPGKSAAEPLGHLGQPGQPGPAVDRFFLCHRPRVWNEVEGKWMGFERKRGKLCDLNRLVTEALDTAYGRPAKPDAAGEGLFDAPPGAEERFSRLAGNTVKPETGWAKSYPVRYIITLDSDTRLPRDAARKLAGGMAHPLNRPVFDRDKGRVVSGYAIMQPRVSITLSSAMRSIYSRLFCCDAGIDPYTLNVSDVYQDIFRHGSYVGKGIYDVRAFERAVKGRFPENTVLSHDLIEGCYAGSCLISDVLLYEDFPMSYAADVRRRHRWVRGDWQILPWILPRVRVSDGGLEDNPLSALSRWKILDNLRRSLSSPALLLLFLLGWFCMPRPLIWTALVLVLVFAQPLLNSLHSMLRRPEDVTRRRYLQLLGLAFGKQCLTTLLNLVWLPHETFYCLDAIARTLWRVLFSKKRMLEWSPSCDAERHSPKTLTGYYRLMFCAPLLGLLLLVLLPALSLRSGVGLWAAALPFALAWLLSPALAWRVSKPRLEKRFAPANGEERFLRGLARRTWGFFETHVGPENNWLPPDNLQEVPRAVLARRTSPTNMGLSLLSHLAAWDMGYLGGAGLLERLEKSLTVMAGLRRYRSHFYNWYDTASLEPLQPEYISSVDSGNLAGHLTILGQGLSRFADEPVFGRRFLYGIADTLDVIEDAVKEDLRRAEGLRAEATGSEAEGSGWGSGFARAGGSRVWKGNGAAGPEQGEAEELTPAVQHRLSAILGRPEWKELRRSVSRALLNRLKNLRQASGLLSEILEAAEKAGQACLTLLQETEGAGLSAANGQPETEFWFTALRGQLLELRSGLDSLALPEEFELIVSGPVPAESEESEPQFPTLRQMAGLELETRTFPNPQAGKRAAQARAAARALLERSERLAELAYGLAQMDFGFLYDPGRKLLSIGYNAGENRLDQSYYDLLASEARLTYYLAIAQGQLPQESWFAMGRLLAGGQRHPVLLSWSGSMFEYLMPMLVMPGYEGSILAETCRSAVRRQMEYGREQGLPWGVSESGYSLQDAAYNYQYKAFGVPGLGLKRGLAEDSVVAPYATVMGLLLEPEEAARNLQRLAGLGLAGRFGLYEAVDYTPIRMPRGKSSIIIRSFMAHHQGMSLLALSGLLCGHRMQERFMAEPIFRSAALLLEERMPRTAPEYLHACNSIYSETLAQENGRHENRLRIIKDPGRPHPEIQLLSNGNYHLMVSSGGGGYSRYGSLALTRWREDATTDGWGSFCYLRDVNSGRYWSTSFQPTARNTDLYEAIFCDAKAEFKVREQNYDAHTEIVVSPEDDVELRRTQVTNRARERRALELTSYAEVVLTQAAADDQHPAFCKLFVETSLEPDLQAIICSRRPRSATERREYMFHLVAVHGARVEAVSYETDRARFVGRGRNLAAPAAMIDPPGLLSNSEGAVLDPIASIRCRVMLEPGRTATIDYVTGRAADREGCLALINKFRDKLLADRVFDLSWTHSQVLLHQYNATVYDAQLYQQMAAHIVYAGSTLRAAPAVLRANSRGQSGLWAQGISGDNPLVLLKITDSGNIDFVVQLVKAHAYWRKKGLVVDLVIWNEDHLSYRQDLHDKILSLIPASTEGQIMDQPGGIFVRAAQQMSREDKILLQTVARMILSDAAGTLAEQVNRRRARAWLPALCPQIAAPLEDSLRQAGGSAHGRTGWSTGSRPQKGLGRAYRHGLADKTSLAKMEQVTRELTAGGGVGLYPAGNCSGSGSGGVQTGRTSSNSTRLESTADAANRAADTTGSAAPQASDGLLLDNGWGGFSPDGSEYVICLAEGEMPPAPWCNVLANERLGSVLSESGGAYTWNENAHEFRLTPWLNDPVGDQSGEAFYLRDDATGAYWSPTPLPVRGRGAYRIRHGFGYSVFEHEEQGIRSELTVFVASEAPVKFALLKLANNSGRARKLSATGYVEWVLGDLRPKTAMFVYTQPDPVSGAILARNDYSTVFAGKTAFFAHDAGRGAECSFTCDRAEFVGRNLGLDAPEAMRRSCLSGSEGSGRFGAGYDPCAALQARFELAAGEERGIVFVLGAGDDFDEAAGLSRQYGDLKMAERELERVRRHWRDMLDTLQVETPDPALDALFNGWLCYQSIASRYLARSGYYQSGGAYGYRDQLQDTMSLVYTRPDYYREQILRCAAHQFVEGDVQHWWHPPTGRGVRTRFSDDYLWLPLAAERYVRITGDAAVLDETIPYIEGRQLNPGEESYYDLPERSGQNGTLFEHCVRAIRRAGYGAHGLPLMGGGDWNDGMDRVGVQGRGESVWLGFFLYRVLRAFEPLAANRKDPEFARFCRETAESLRESLESNAWDGAWYRRAYFDDGTPLGSASNPECRIDSIAQSWSVLSGAAPDWRQRRAMQSLDENLVDREHQLIRLFTPPFDKSSLEPGYIKGYVPGVRENGGQYTHAAVWAAMAFAELDDAEKAWELTAMLNPVRHGDSRRATDIYKVEPYVLAADVYAVKPHQGRGGWSWYTGAAGWYYRLLLESLLGFRLEENRLWLDPLYNPAWTGREIRLTYRYGKSRYRLRLRVPEGGPAGGAPNPADGVQRMSLDGRPHEDPFITLLDDGQDHEVEIWTIPLGG